MADFILEGRELLKCCPFNMNHIVAGHRYDFHLRKCPDKMKYSVSGEELRKCPFNESHVVTREDYERHLQKECEDANRIVRQIAAESDELEQILLKYPSPKIDDDFLDNVKQKRFGLDIPGIHRKPSVSELIEDVVESGNIVSQYGVQSLSKASKKEFRFGLIARIQKKALKNIQEEGIEEMESKL